MDYLRPPGAIGLSVLQSRPIFRGTWLTRAIHIGTFTGRSRRMGLFCRSVSGTKDDNRGEGYRALPQGKGNRDIVVVTGCLDHNYRARTETGRVRGSEDDIGNVLHVSNSLCLLLTT
jgi:hypothetical protein